MPLFGQPGNGIEAVSPTVSPNNVVSQVLAPGTEGQTGLVILPSESPRQRLSEIPNLFPERGSTLTNGPLADARLESLLPVANNIGSVIGASSSLNGVTSLSVNEEPEENINDNIDAGLLRFMDAIAQIESGRRPTAEGPATRYGTAKGKYQFVDATWRRAIRLTGYNPRRYLSALQAPEAVQDAVAAAWFESLLRRYNGNWRAVAIAHHGGEGTADAFLRNGSTNASDVLGTRSDQYAQRALNLAFNGDNPGDLAQREDSSRRSSPLVSNLTRSSPLSARF